MNVTITKNNLILIIKELEANPKPSDKSKAYLQFIKDGLTTIEILNTMVDDLNNTIGVNFRSEVVKKIEEKQLGLKLIEKEKEVVYLKTLIEEQNKKIDKVLNDF